jgi:hypothetical protein
MASPTATDSMESAAQHTAYDPRALLTSDRVYPGAIVYLPAHDDVVRNRAFRANDGKTGVTGLIAGDTDLPASFYGHPMYTPTLAEWRTNLFNCGSRLNLSRRSIWTLLLLPPGLCFLVVWLVLRAFFVFVDFAIRMAERSHQAVEAAQDFLDENVPA